MSKFLTGRVRIEQTEKPKIWRLLDNVVYKDKDNKLYIAPRNFQTDLYTIPTWIDFLTGNSSEHDCRCCIIHDLFCSTVSSVIIILTEEELIEKGYLRYIEEKKIWTCENVPAEFLEVSPISKLKANNIFGRALKVAGVRIPQRWLIRLGVAFNIGFYLNQLFGKTRDIELDKFYDAEFWDFIGK